MPLYLIHPPKSQQLKVGRPNEISGIVSASFIVNARFEWCQHAAILLDSR